MRKVVGLLVVVVAASALAGCAVKTEGRAFAAEPALRPEPVVQAGVVPAGESGTDLADSCPLPITFTVAEGWRAEAIDADLTAELDPDDPAAEFLASLLTRGPFTVACEADARGTGEIGFLRVYTAPGPSEGPTANLEAYLAAENPRGQESGIQEITDVSLTEVELGGQPGGEVTYTSYNEPLDLEDAGLAFTLDTPEGAVLVALDGLEADELRPAYELAKQTVRLT